MKARIALAALGLAASALPATSPPQPHDHVVPIVAMRFGPSPTGVRAGDTIVWVNRDVVPHTATARDRSFDIVVPPGRSARMMVRRGGVVEFYCRFHPTMLGQLTVAPR